MVKLLMDHMANACSMLEKYARYRQNEIHTVEDVMKSLESLSGMERVTWKLRTETETLKQEQKEWLDMLQGLICIRRIYVQAEKRICDCAEGNTIKFHYPNTTYINIPVLENDIIIQKIGEEHE